MRIVIHGGEASSLLLFRYHLMKELRDRGHEVVAAAPKISGDIRRRLAEIGVTTVKTGFKRASISPLVDLSSLIGLHWKLRQIRPDMILSYTIKPVIFGTIAGRLARVPRRVALITGRGHPLSDDAHWTLKAIARLLYRI